MNPTVTLLPQRKFHEHDDGMADDEIQQGILSRCVQLATFPSSNVGKGEMSCKKDSRVGGEEKLSHDS